MKATDSPAGIEQALLKFVQEIGCIGPDDSRFSADIDLYDTGYLDSLGIVALTTFLEETYGVILSEQELFDPRMVTVAGIAEIVGARAAGNQSAGTSAR